MQAFAHHTALERRVEHGEAKLDATEEVAVHPVGAGKEHILRATVMEEEYARVLEETADHGAHPDVCRKAFDAGLERAHAADDEVDPHPGRRSEVELLDDLRL